VAHNQVSAAPKAARRIGKYELLGRIAEGGMGTLFKARHPTLGRTVLLKRLALHGGGQLVERFKREARLMMDLKSERIVQVFDHFKEGPHYVIVEEYVEGQSLDALIRRERYLSNDAATLVLHEVCKALKFAHDRQVIHRDIKPANILISRLGEVKLADFGIATSRDEEEDGITRDGTILGTPAYLAPEQIDDPRTVDHRADIYSLGVVLYEMVTGRTPFPATLTADTIAAIHRGRYAPPQRLNPRCSPFLRRIIHRCMKVRRRLRFQDVDAILRLLERRIRQREPEALQAAIQTVLKGGDLRQVFRRRGSWAARMSVAALLVCILAAAALWTQRQGYWYEYFAADRYGALVITAVVNTSSPEGVSLPADPVLYNDDRGLTRIEGIDFGMHEDSARRTADQRVIESRKLYLPPGRYRVKLALEGGLFWSSFTVAPRAKQREQLATADALRVDARDEPAVHLPLRVRFTAHDAQSGADLGGTAHLLVGRGGAWVPPADLPMDLTTGVTWRFRIEAPGYVPVDYWLVVKPSQAVLDLDARMERRQP
jgi:eukaryotic-like serine/threonine-protein kinase